MKVDQMRELRYRNRFDLAISNCTSHLVDCVNQAEEWGLFTWLMKDFHAEEANLTNDTIISLDYLNIYERIARLWRDHNSQVGDVRIQVGVAEIIVAKFTHNSGVQFTLANEPDDSEQRDAIQSSLSELSDLYKKSSTMSALSYCAEQINRHSKGKVSTYFESNQKIEIEHELMFFIKMLTDLYLPVVRLVDFVQDFAKGFNRSDLLRILIQEWRNSPLVTETYIAGERVYVLDSGRGFSLLVFVENEGGFNSTKLPTFRLGININDRESYFERPDAFEAYSMPFLETKGAQELINALAKQGLEFAPNFIDKFTGWGRIDRYGCIATEISREMCKLLLDPHRNVAYLLKDDNQAYHDYEFVNPVYRKLAALDGSGCNDPVAKSLIGVLTQLGTTRVSAAEHNESDAKNSDIPVVPPSANILFREGTCSDVFSYCERCYEYNNFEEVYVGGKRLLMIKEGYEKFINLEPVTVYGVAFEPGWLFRRFTVGDDIAYAPLRLTPYIDTPTSWRLGAFSAEVIKHQHQKGRKSSGLHEEFFQREA